MQRASVHVLHAVLPGRPQLGCDGCVQKSGWGQRSHCLSIRSLALSSPVGLQASRAPRIGSHTRARSHCAPASCVPCRLWVPLALTHALQPREACLRWDVRNLSTTRKALVMLSVCSDVGFATWW